jgi:hypothetical protein
MNSSKSTTPLWAKSFRQRQNWQPKQQPKSQRRTVWANDSHPWEANPSSVEQTPRSGRGVSIKPGETQVSVASTGTRPSPTMPHDTQVGPPGPGGVADQRRICDEDGHTPDWYVHASQRRPVDGKQAVLPKTDTGREGDWYGSIGDKQAAKEESKSFTHPGSQVEPELSAAAGAPNSNAEAVPCVQL